MLWGIDLGGTKIEAVVLEPGELTPLARKRIPTEASGGYRRVVARIAQLVAEVSAEHGIEYPKQIGIGTPGAVDPATGLLKNSNTTCLNGMPLQQDLCDALGAEVICANDANCFALAEATLGAAVGYPTVFGVIMGTGVGGGIVVSGQVLAGCQDIAGEWGHTILEPDGEPCYCGRRGCVETVISGPALERFYTERSGEALGLREIFSRARSGQDAAAELTLRRLCEEFGHALAQVVNILDPHAIVLGGGVGAVPELMSAGSNELSKWVFNDRLRTPLLAPKLGDSAGVFGAAMLYRLP